MNVRHDRNAIIGAWIEEGPTELPESTRRAIAVDIRTTPQSRPSWWAPWAVPTMTQVSPVTVAAVMVVALMLGGVALFGGHPDGGGNVGGGPSVAPSASSTSPSPSPSPSPPPLPDPTAWVIPSMTQTHVSTRHGYSVRYPADWSREEARESWSPVAWKAAGSPGDPFDYLVSRDETARFRVASAPVPVGMTSVNDWIDEFLIYGDEACVPPRASQELVIIDAAPGRLWDACGEIEATVVLEGRVYMFTLFHSDAPSSSGRELFDAFAATIDLRPEDAAAGRPSP